MKYETRLTILQKFEEIQLLSSNFEKWSTSKIGADLWLDGFDSICSTEKEHFIAYLDYFEEYSIFNNVDIDAIKNKETELLDICENYILECRKQGEAHFWHALAVCISVFLSIETIYSLSNNQDVVIINDTVLMILSREYRNIRFSAYNLGVIYTTSTDAINLDTFRPEQLFFEIGVPILVDSKHPFRVHGCNINHELIHIVFFADNYLKLGNNLELQVEEIVDIEETCVGVDPLIYHDLAKYDIDLNVITEYKKYTSSSESIFDELIESEEKFMNYQLSLRETALNLIRLGVYQSNDYARIQEWITPEEFNTHIKGAQSMAIRLSNIRWKQLAEIVQLINCNNLDFSSFNRVWSLDQLSTISVVNPNPRQRHNSLLNNFARSIILTTADFIYISSQEFDTYDLIQKYLHEIIFYMNSLELNPATKGYEINNILYNIKRVLLVKDGGFFYRCEFFYNAFLKSIL